MENEDQDFNNGQQNFNEDQQGWQTARSTGSVNGYEHYVPEPEDGPGFAIAGMVCGILSILCCCFWYIALVLGIVGMVLSIISIRQHKPGKGMAIAGIICSAIGLGISLFMGVISIIMMIHPNYQNQMMNNFYQQYGNPHSYGSYWD